MLIRDRIKELRRVPASALRPSPKNWRSHPQRQREALQGVLAELGYCDALIAREDGDGSLILVDGHLRAETTPDMDVPVLILDVTEAEADKLLVTLDPLASLAEADKDKLDSLLRQVQTESAAVAGMLTDLAARNGIVPAGANGTPAAEEAPPPADKAEELLAKWEARPGDIWRAGDHYVLCGDCREPESWGRLLRAAGVKKVNGVFTSPPYAEQRKEQYGGVPTDEYVMWWERVQLYVREHLTDDGSFFVNIKPHCEDGERVLYVFDLVLAMKRQWGWRFVDELCWKHHGYPGQVFQSFRNAFEPVYHFAVNKPCKICPDNVAYQSDAVIDYASERREAMSYDRNHKGNAKRVPGMAYPRNVIEATNSASPIAAGHAAAFPVALPDFFVRAFSDQGDVWADPFAGSGTVAVAAQQNGRRAVLIERLPKYVAVILERLAGLDLDTEKVA